MNVLFIQNYWQPYLGIAYIAAKIRSEGHRASLLIEEKIDDKLLASIKKEAPHVVAFSVMTSSLRWTLAAVKWIKSNLPSVKIVLGGIHPTIRPDVIENEGIDFICRGEGEIPFLELLNALENGTDYRSIKNIDSKDGDKIIRNEIRNLIEDLDSLPFPDRSLYYDPYPFLAKLDSKSVIIGRGCPFPCTFCVNHSLIQLYKGKGKFVRRRSPENVLAEIRDMRSTVPLKHIYFNDDTFTLDIHWLGKFLASYKEMFSIPFTCGTRADLVTPELISLLKNSGCYCVEMGIETGNEEFRYKLLKKNITNEQIIRAAGIIKNSGLYLKTSNMTALPGETLELAFQTIHLNRAIAADFVNCSLLQPYPSLEITDYAMEKGYLPHDFDFLTLTGMSYRKNPIQGREIDQLVKLQRFFLLLVKFKWLEPVVKKLLVLPQNFVFDLVFKLSFLWNYAQYHKLSFLQVIRLAFRGRKHF